MREQRLDTLKSEKARGRKSGDAEADFGKSEAAVAKADGDTGTHHQTNEQPRGRSRDLQPVGKKRAREQPQGHCQKMRVHLHTYARLRRVALPILARFLVGDLR